MNDILPAYVVLSGLDSPAPGVLRKPAQPFSFPLSPEDQKIIQILEAKFDQEEHCSGLAAPQIGFGKRAIVFAVPDDKDLKKWRPDLTDTIDKTIWLNPAYEAVGNETHADYESCFSVRDLAGLVSRYKTVNYSATRIDGTMVTGTASGFLARVIQHEIDHLNGKLFIDYVPKEQLLSIAQYREQRAQSRVTG